MAWLSYPSHDSGTILEQLIDQVPWNINAGLPPVSQPTERQAGPTEATRREREKAACVKKKLEMHGYKKAAGKGWLRMFFFPFNSELAIKACQLWSQK